MRLAKGRLSPACFLALLGLNLLETCEVVVASVEADLGTATPPHQVVDRPQHPHGRAPMTRLGVRVLQRGTATRCTRGAAWPSVDEFDRRVAMGSSGQGSWRWAEAHACRPQLRHPPSPRRCRACARVRRPASDSRPDSSCASDTRAAPPRACRTSAPWSARSPQTSHAGTRAAGSAATLPRAGIQTGADCVGASRAEARPPPPTSGPRRTLLATVELMRGPVNGFRICARFR